LDEGESPDPISRDLEMSQSYPTWVFHPPGYTVTATTGAEASMELLVTVFAPQRHCSSIKSVQRKAGLKERETFEGGV
jgi:hypothetical protein